MSLTLRVLIIEDIEDDALIMVRELKRAGYELIYERVETAGAMRDAIGRQEWDVILADYSLPQFSGIEAMTIMKDNGLDLPFIIVTGTIADDIAVAAMKAGAHDYIMKDNLRRLVPAIERELKERLERQDRKKAEEALRESQQLIAKTLYSLYEAVFIIDGTTRKVINCNPASSEMFGYSREELIGDIPEKLLVDEASLENLRSYLYPAVAEKGYLQQFELEMKRKDGSIIPVETSVISLTNDKGERVGWVGVVRDITEQKKAREALLKSEQRLKEAQRIGKIGNWEFDLSTRQIEWSDEVYRLYERDMNLGPPTTEEEAAYYAPEEARRLTEFTRLASEDGAEFDYEVTANLPSGKTITLSTTMCPIRDVEERIIKLFGTVQDITEKKMLQEQLIISDRLASIGQLASGIAHELNNPLTSVIGFSELLLRREDLPNEAKEDIKIIHTQAQRTSQVVKGLLAFARKETNKKEPLDLCSVLQNVLQLRNYEQKVSNITVQTEIDPECPKVIANAAQMQQAFTNIIVNAEQAMLEYHNKGTLTIKVHKDGDILQISFSDDGNGISPENIKKLFTPFFTTKEVGKGTGLGLSICHGIVTEHGGRIYAQSELGKGSIFTIELPVAE